MQQGQLHPASLGAKELLHACTVESLRRSGPGGQRRNKVETAVRLHHRPTGVRAEATERRSRTENQRTALFRLRVNLALEVRWPRDSQRGPSSLWQARCHRGRIDVNPSHDDFPAMLAEALDMIAACEQDLKKTAEALRCSRSQLIKLLKKEPRAMTVVNQRRRQLGLGPLQ